MKRVRMLIIAIMLFALCVGCTPKTPFEKLSDYIADNENCIQMYGDITDGKSLITEIKLGNTEENLCFRAYYLYDDFTLDVEIPFKYQEESQKVYLSYHFDDVGPVNCSGYIDTYSYSGMSSPITSITCDNYYFYDTCQAAIKTYTNSLLLDVYKILEDADIDVTLRDLGFEKFP